MAGAWASMLDAATPAFFCRRPIKIFLYANGDYYVWKFVYSQLIMIYEL